MSCTELCQTTKELVKVLDSGDDSEQLLLVTESGKNNIELVKQRNVEVRQIVQALTKLGDKESKMFSTHSQENKENVEAISELEKVKYNKCSGIEKLNTALVSLENSIREIDEESSKLRKEKADIQNTVGDALPKTKYSFSLYSNITRLRWDYDIDGDKLQGFVSSLRDVRPFTLDVKEHSKHFIANYLWDVIALAKNSKA